MTNLVDKDPKLTSKTARHITFFSFCDPSIIWPHEAIFKWCTLSECSCLFCRRMCCRDAVVAFKVFCLHLSCSDSLLFQADSCPSVSFPSHGRVHWRSKVRTALHIQHREMWINLDGEGNDQLHRYLICDLFAILDSASSDVLRWRVGYFPAPCTYMHIVCFVCCFYLLFQLHIICYPDLGP